MDRDAGGYRLQRYGEVYSEITDESTRYEIFKGHVDFYPANAGNLSFSLKVTEFFDQPNSEVSVPECWVQAQQCLVVAACESTVTAPLTERKLFVETQANPRRNLKN